VAVRSCQFIELCAGVGGLGLGVHLAEPDSRCVAYVEREAYAASVLVARMAAGDLDSAPVWSELATFDARPWRGAVDCVVSGDPCQPNSIAGRKGGADDDRFLVEHVIRVFDETGAVRLFRENVTGNADGQLAALVPTLESMGCTVAAGIFAASEVGASHRRERLFVMADRNPGTSCARAVDYAMCRRHRGEGAEVRAGWHGTVVPGDATGILADGQAEGRGAGIGAAQAGTWPGEQRGRRLAGGGLGGDLVDPDCPRPQGRRDDLGEHAGEWDSRSAGALLPAFAPGPRDPRWPEFIEAAPGLEPAILRVADGVACRVDRLRCVGNGAVPLVAAYAWRTLAAVLAEGRGAGPFILNERVAA